MNSDLLYCVCSVWDSGEDLLDFQANTLIIPICPTEIPPRSQMAMSRVHSGFLLGKARLRFRET